jgi:5'-nucleotidase
MRILITNDDGIHAPGLEMLARVAGEHGEVWVVAPDTERSGSSHAITLYHPLRLRQVAERWQSCNGTPTDCVYLALHQMAVKPDLVLSGVNPGANLAHDVLYSGTVSGALEGSHWGVPSLALSHCSGVEAEMALLEPRLRTLLPELIEAALRHGGCLNVNFPPVTKGEYRGLQVARLGKRYYSNEVHERHDPRGRGYYWIGGAKVNMPDIPGSDCNGVRDGYVTVTPIGDDLTRTSVLGELTAHFATAKETA